MDVKDTVCVVAGASGTGLALCTRFAQEGGHVVLSDLDRDVCERQAMPIAALPVAADVRPTREGRPSWRSRLLRRRKSAAKDVTLPALRAREVDMPDQAITGNPDELLAGTVMKLARRNEALEEFAALVAHEVKAPLQAALATGDSVAFVRQALDLVDALLEVARESPGVGIASPATCLDDALRDLGAGNIATTADLPARLPLPPTVLRLLLSNLLRNAAAGGARSVHVSAKRCSGRWLLEVEDDGVGLDSDACYRRGTGLGLHLCRRIASRYGGSIVLAPSPTGGTRATLELGRAA